MPELMQKIVLAVLGLAMLGGCANNPLLRTGAATSTDTARDIEQNMDEALEQIPEAAQRGPAPEDVTDELMPEMDADSQRSEEETFNIDARQLPARTFFRSLVDGTDYNVLVHPQVSGDITVELDQVTVAAVMNQVSDLYDFHIERERNIFRVQPGGVQTRIFQMDNLNIQRRGDSETRVRSGQVSNTQTGDGQSSDNGGSATAVGTSVSTQTESTFWRNLEQSLNMIIGSDTAQSGDTGQSSDTGNGGDTGDGSDTGQDSSDGRKVITSPGTGVVVVKAKPEELAMVEDYLQRVELISQRQVILEARILEVELEKGYQQGINWNLVDDKTIPNTSIETSLGAPDLSSANVGGVFSTSLDIGDFNTLIELLGRQGNVQVLSSPRISTVNNEKAVIKVGSDELFVTDLDFDDTSTATTQTSRSTDVDLNPFFSGISLDVTPQISENNVVTLHVHPAVVEVEDQEKLITIGARDVTLPLARSTVRETDSIVSARNGEIVVIGGLIRSDTEETSSAVPFFSEIPVMGEMFKQRRFEQIKSELVILLRPMIVDAEQARQDVAASRERMRELRRIMESPQSPMPDPAKPRQPQK